MNRFTTSARFASALATAFLAAIAIASAAPPAQTAPVLQQQLQPVQVAQSDAMIYNITTQNSLCKLEQHPPTGGTYWQSTMNLNIDRASPYKGQIVAYHYKVFGGSTYQNGWTDWYVPGYNDIASKFYLGNHSLERMWSIFQDHQHEFIICR
jgi:hypothetical protein